MRRQISNIKIQHNNLHLNLNDIDTTSQQAPEVGRVFVEISKTFKPKNPKYVGMFRYYRHEYTTYVQCGIICWTSRNLFKCNSITK